MHEQELKETKSVPLSDELMNIKQTAAWFDMAPVTIYRLMARGEIPGRKIGGQWRFSKSHLLAWICAGDATAAPTWLRRKRLMAAALDHEEPPTC